MSIKSKILKLANLSLSLPGLYALATWPKFSYTSFFMVNDLKRQGLSPMTVIDVGANVGQFAVSCLKAYPDAKLYSFEPNPACVAELAKNLAGFEKSSIFCVAVGSEVGELPFNINEHSHSSSLLPLTAEHLGAYPSAREVDVIKVKVDTLDNLLSGVPLTSPVLLKVDVQGFEAQVLAGAAATLANVDYVLIETSFKQLYQGELLFMDMVRLMERHGFGFVRPVGWLCDPNTDEVIQMDSLFGRV